MTTPQLDVDTRLFGLVEHFFDGHTMDELDGLLDHQMVRVSGKLEDWLRNERE
jgi:hypothetical protein